MGAQPGTMTTASRAGRPPQHHLSLTLSITCCPGNCQAVTQSQGVPIPLEPCWARSEGCWDGPPHQNPLMGTPSTASLHPCSSSHPHPHSHSLDIPTSKHFWSRQYWHRLRVTLLMMQFLSRWHVYTMFFWMLRRKKPWGPRTAPSAPATGTPSTPRSPGSPGGIQGWWQRSPCSPHRR